MTTAPPSGLELTALGQDTARLIDRRIGLAIRIPGHPRLLAAAASSGVSEPMYEALIELADLPVTLRYRRNDTDPDANLDVALLVDTYAANRARREDLTRAQPASAEQCRLWGVRAAASTIYPLREPDASGDDMEETLVLAREASIVTLTKRFARARTSAVSYSLCSSALAAGIRWDPAALEAATAPLWPPSRFLVPGVSGTLLAGCKDVSGMLAQLAAPHRSAAVRLGDALPDLLHGSEAPAYPITAPELARYEAYVADLAEDPELGRALIALLHEVRTAHDLRGFALLGLHALGKYPASFAATGVDDQRAFGYMAE